MAPAAKPPRPQPQPQPPRHALAGAEVTNAAPPMVAAATRAVRIFLMTSPRSEFCSPATARLVARFPFIGECRLNESARIQPPLLRRRRFLTGRPETMRCHGLLAEHSSAIVPQSRYDQHFVMGKAKLELKPRAREGAVTGGRPFHPS